MRDAFNSSKESKGHYNVTKDFSKIVCSLEFAINQGILKKNKFVI